MFYLKIENTVCFVTFGDFHNSRASFVLFQWFNRFSASSHHRICFISPIVDQWTCFRTTICFKRNHLLSRRDGNVSSAEHVYCQKPLLYSSIHSLELNPKILISLIINCGTFHWSYDTCKSEMHIVSSIMFALS